jgi:hypothetical protein
MITWHDRLRNLHSRYGRDPTLQEMLDEAKHHTMTPEEVKAQAESWARGMAITGDPAFD